MRNAPTSSGERARASGWAGGWWRGALTSSREGALRKGGGPPRSNPGEEVRPEQCAMGAMGMGATTPVLAGGAVAGTTVEG